MINKITEDSFGMNQQNPAYSALMAIHSMSQQMASFGLTDRHDRGYCSGCYNSEVAVAINIGLAQMVILQDNGSWFAVGGRGA